jgi:hypothetical protein
VTASPNVNVTFDGLDARTLWSAGFDDSSTACALASGTEEKNTPTTTIDATTTQRGIAAHPVRRVIRAVLAAPSDEASILP